MKKILFILFPAGFILAVSMWGYDCANMFTGSLFGDPSGRLLAFGRLAGLLAAAGILAQLLLISRARWLEPLYGLDRLTRAHHVLGLAIPLMIVLHPVFIAMHYAGQEAISFTEQFSALLAWDNALNAGAGALLIIAAVVMSLPFLRRRFSYEVWHTSHLFLYAGFILALDHQFELGGDINDNRYFAWTWYALYVFAACNLAWGRLLRPLWQYRKHKFFVEKIVPETTEVESIWVTGRGMESFPAEAGQFALLRFWAPGFRTQAHPFSISKAPDGKYLRFSIKKTGDFTAAVHYFLKPGVPVLLDGPHGTFTGKKCLGDKALLIAGGIGITPLRALAEFFQASGKDCVLLYASRFQKDIVFRREFSELESRGGFKVHYVLSAGEDWPGEKGHIDSERIKRLTPDFAERDAFLCGPPPMIAAVKASLLGLGMSETRIHYELFSFY